MSTNKIEDQPIDILKNYPETSLIKDTKYHLKIPVNKEVSIEINFDNYPKRPRAKLIRANGKHFNLYRIVSSLRDWNKETPSTISEVIEEIFLLIRSIELNQIVIEKEFLKALMELCLNRHPHKFAGILGTKKGIVSEFILSSRTCTAPKVNLEDLLPTCNVPLNFSYEGTIISRPSGDLSINKNLVDILEKRRFTMLLAYPYDSLECIRCLDSHGNQLDLKTV